MTPFINSYAMLAVSALYCVWHHHQLAREARLRAQRQGVARLLWAAAMGDNDRQFTS